MNEDQTFEEFIDEEFKDYPNIREAVKEPNAYPAIPSGWYPLVEELIEELKKFPIDYKVGQIKEKFWGLRFYVDIDDYSIIDPETLEKFNKTISEYEEKSYRTCFTCGVEATSSEETPRGGIRYIYPCDHQ